MQMQMRPHVRSWSNAASGRFGADRLRLAARVCGMRPQNRWAAEGSIESGP
jgi:hypothetical protein